jgi:hypothetical protein
MLVSLRERANAAFEIDECVFATGKCSFHAGASRRGVRAWDANNSDLRQPRLASAMAQEPATVLPVSLVVHGLIGDRDLAFQDGSTRG